MNRYIMHNIVLYVSVLWNIYIYIQCCAVYIYIYIYIYIYYVYKIGPTV